MLKIFLSLILFESLLISSTEKWIPSFAGPYRITIRRINNETTEFNSTGELWAHLYFSHPKPKQMQYTWGYFNLGIPIDDTLKADIRISQWANNEWKKNAFIMKFPRACSDLLFHAKSVVDFVWKPHERKCPFPAYKLRKMENQTFEAVFPQFPMLPYARYLFTMAFLKGDKVVGVFVADGNATPKL